jgi:hypothetical protein
MDDAQEKPRPGPPREVDPRDDEHVAGSPVRCPFCHDDVAIEGEWSACSRCLARHHQPCWTEGGRCAACGHDGAVRHEREAKKSDEAARRRSKRALVGALLVIVLGFVGLVFLGYLGAVSAHNARLEERRAQAMFDKQFEASQRAEPKPSAPYEKGGALARYEKDGALVVEDGRGNFVVVVEGENAVVFGLGAVLESVDAGKVIAVSHSGKRQTFSRPLKPLIVYQDNRGASFSTESPERPGMTTAELTALLRATRPPDLDLREVLRRVRGD